MTPAQIEQVRQQVRKLARMATASPNDRSDHDPIYTANVRDIVIVFTPHILKLVEALEPFDVGEDTCEDLRLLGRDDGKPRQAILCSNKLTDHQLIAVRAALAPFLAAKETE